MPLSNGYHFAVPTPSPGIRFGQLRAAAGRVILRSRFDVPLYLLAGVALSWVVLFLIGLPDQVSDGWVFSVGLLAMLLATASLVLRQRHFAPTLALAIGQALGSSAAIAATANLDEDLDGTGDRVAIGFAMLLLYSSAIWITFVGGRFLRWALKRHP